MTIGEFSGVTGVSGETNIMTVLEQQKKWEEYLDNLDEKIKFYWERMGGNG